MAATRYTQETGIEIRQAAGGWRHVDTNAGDWRDVGPTYATRAELLADHESYLIRAGWLMPSQAGAA